MAKKILITDDDFDQRDLYVELFSDNGYKAIPAADGIDGLEKAAAEKPDLIFTGINMPRMNGFEFIQNLRKNPETAQTPVIMFSHLGREDDSKKAAALANVDFMVKGFDGPPKILQRVKDLIGEANSDKVVAKPAPYQTSAPVYKSRPSQEKPATPNPPMTKPSEPVKNAPPPKPDLPPKPSVTPPPLSKPSPPKPSPRRPQEPGRDRGGSGMIIV